VRGDSVEKTFLTDLQEMMNRSGFESGKQKDTFFRNTDDGIQTIEFFCQQLSADRFLVIPRISIYFPSVNNIAWNIFDDCISYFPVLLNNDSETYALSNEYLSESSQRGFVIFISDSSEENYHDIKNSLGQYTFPFLENVRNIKGFLELWEKNSLPFADKWIVYIISAYYFLGQKEKAFNTAENWFDKNGMRILSKKILPRIISL